jgi:hypothetical protein
MKSKCHISENGETMRKIFIALGAIAAMAGAAMASSSEPNFNPVPMVEVSAEFGVMAALPQITSDVEFLAVAEPALGGAPISTYVAHGAMPVLILSAQADVMPDFALSGGDGHLT